MPQSLVISCCDDNKERGGTTNVVLEYGYEWFGLLCLYTRPKPLTTVSFDNIVKNLKNEKKIIFRKNE